ncbi:hypothetical protein PL321_16735 [Caloramator sp. mosi_1]|uniref:hypothetical protein n=1 Tax=Caloramator sp. mosi_1 TaxID=3023090 RepID=UPI002361E8C5|nr:hypothetical protein [Caloramator sp. mosi_1]WDC83998.1 hypothetical protein PL321_16735 [Caloramator sp. mosi_1]
MIRYIKSIFIRFKNNKETVIDETDKRERQNYNNKVDVEVKDIRENIEKIDKKIKIVDFLKETKDSREDFIEKKKKKLQLIT